ncbi:signal peptidase I [Candidatus Parcubacteria bacterium]|nr:signal peptidase I [Candidatus Parcubacteria bacterium]
MPQEHRESFLTELLKFTLFAFIIVFPVRLFIAQPFIVSGASMVPTFENGQYLIIDELTYHFESPARGDVIVFRYPRDPKEFFIKRIIGLPGETVDIKDGKISVTKTDGTTIALSDDYIVNQGNGSAMRATLSSDEYFVMGDNRPESSDSRVWGPLPRQNIVGRAFLRLLPVQNLSLFPGNVDLQQ